MRCGTLVKDIAYQRCSRHDTNTLVRGTYPPSLCGRLRCPSRQWHGSHSRPRFERVHFLDPLRQELSSPKVSEPLGYRLEEGTPDGEYLDQLSHGLDIVLNQPTFDLAIYLAGADPYEGDRLGKLMVSKAGLMERDRMVLERLRKQNIPIAIAMAGGYAPNVEDIVDIHAATLRIASQLYWQNR